MSTRSSAQKKDTTYKPTSKYSLTKKSIDDNYYIQHTQCNEINGKYYIININPYTNELLQESLPLITDVNDLKNGIYTFIVLGFDDEETQIYG